LDAGVRTRRSRKRTIPAGVEPHDLARRLALRAAEKKAEDVLVLDLRGLSSACDFFVLASALSEPHVSSIAEHLEEAMAAEGIRPWHVEGRRNRKWVLVDFVDVVVHLFLKETREYYRLENLWAEAPREEIRAEAPATEREAGGRRVHREE
jgi:ribosome-associated protein